MNLSAISLGLTRIYGAPFLPSSLFAAGEQGVWYDPSDFDRYMAPLGPEVCTDPAFDNPLAWSAGTGITVSGGSAVYASPAHGTNLDNVPATFLAGKTYLVKVTVSAFTSGRVTVYINKTTGTTAGGAKIGGSTGVFQTIITAATNGTGLGLQADGVTAGACVLTLSDVTVRELTAIDTATLFQDSAGTTPVTAVEQPVGLMLDKSKGLVLGSELASGWLDSSSGWTLDSGWSITSGAVVGGTGANSTYASKPLTTVAGRWYKVDINVASLTGTLQFNIRQDAVTGAALAGRDIANQTGTFSLYFVAATTTSVLRFGDFLSSVSINAISIRELPGNHAFQATSTSRPVLSARYNLLTKTEDFDDAVFTKKNFTITANTAAAPNGTMTADLAVPDTTNTTHYVFFPRISSLTFCTSSVYVQAAGLTKVALRESATAGSYASFDLTTGTVIETGNVAPGSVSSAVITSVGGGWFRISANFSGTASQLIGIWPLPNSYTTGNPAINWSGDGTNGLRIWGADLRVTNDAAGQPAYQRVNTATDYDTAGFKPYLRFDGTDDWMQTNSIDFTATDKMTVFAGVRKLSDAARGMLVELGSSLPAGSFSISAPAGASPSYSVFSSGSVGVGPIPSVGTFSAPISNVLTFSSNIGSDSLVLRINQTPNTGDSGDQGTGNYSNAPLYIGRRGGTTLPFNGRLYGLIVRGAQSTAQQITSTENWLNQRTGAF